MLKSAGLSFTLKVSFDPSWYCTIVHEALGKHWCPTYAHLPNGDPFRHVIPTSLLLAALPIWWGESKSWETIKLRVVNPSFPNFWFLLEISDIIIGKRWAQLFSLKWQVRFVHFQEDIY